MSRIVKRALERTRQEMMSCFKEFNPSREFNAKLFLGLVWLHLIAARIEKTQNMEERRNLINEFYQDKKTIEKGIRMLRKAEKTNPEEAKSTLHRAVS